MTFAAIDFGTSNSTIGISHQGAPTLLPVEDSARAVPTAVFFPFGKTDAMLGGNAAIHAYLDEESGRFMRGLKGVLGTSLFNETTQVRNRQLSFAEIIGSYLNWLLTPAQKHFQKPITQLLLGRPVHFHTDDPAADTLAQTQLLSVVKSLGIQQVEFLYEPLAAAYHHEASLQAEQLALILDIGGGTTDLTVMRLGPQRRNNPNRTADILATHGLRLGGTDIDKLFALHHVMPHFAYRSPLLALDGTSKGLTVPDSYYHQLTTWHRIHRLYEKETLFEIRQLLTEASEPKLLTRLLTLLENRHGHRLMLDLEAAKINLSHQSQTPLNLAWIDPLLALTLTQTQLAEAIASWQRSLGQAITYTLQLANIQPSQLGTIFLTGGPSAMPLVQATTRQHLPNIPLIQGDQLTSVGQGLTLAAMRLFG